MTIDIRPGTLRDICFVAANMREQDRLEVFATARLETATEAGVISYHSSAPDWCWTAWLRGQPIAAFGVGYGNPIYQPHIRHAWAYGTARFKRAVPAISRFTKENWPQGLFAEGVTRVEIRSLQSHDIAHRWLAGLGARREAEMPNYGVNGETFELWALLRQDHDDVLLNSENP